MEPVGNRALALIGFMGSGKSAVGALLAACSGAPHHDLDEMIETRSGMAIAELFAREGELAFRALESELLPRALESGAVASLGGGAPLDEANWNVIRERALTVFLDAPLDVLLARSGSGKARPMLAGRSRESIGALLDSRLPRYREAEYVVAADRPLEQVAEEVLKLWRG